ncbi:uncharacterized protein LOC123556483 isoform X2 [Mercenaria mercenaria]|nr:uncharacterized protein LOC123556483 isoform X2 [Mercenaria mercenaria]
MPSAQLNDGNSHSLDLSNPTPETIGQITGLNVVSRGTDHLPLSQDNKSAIPNITDLHEINSILGGDWRNLALVISTDDNRKMIGIVEKEAEKKVKIHFADAREKQKKNLEVQFDVTLNDLITRIEHLLSADVHWLCLAHCLEEEPCVELTMITRVYEALPDFNTFWAAFSMPHYDSGPETEKRNQQNGEQEDNKNNTFMELNVLKQEVEDQDTKDHLPQTFREKKKFWRFILQENLLKYASSLNSNELSKKFTQLSQMKIDKVKWEAYLNKLGISRFKKKKPARHNCITYGTKNPDFCGEQVIGKNNCVGSLGWVLANSDGPDCQLTSSHVLLDESRHKELSKVENENKMVKLKHTFLCKLGRGCDLECYCFRKEIIGLIRSGCYKIGDNVSAGVEIIAVETGNQYRFFNKDIPAGYIYYHWKMFGFPDTLYFRCQFWNHKNIEKGMVVFKLGHSTGLTKGRLQSKESCFEFPHPFSKDKKNPSLVTLHNQYEVAWDDPEFPFSKEGDSGGPVFTVNNETGEITAVGLLTGNNEKREVSFVTPLDQVLEIFGTQYSLRNFEITLRKRL